MPEVLSVLYPWLVAAVGGFLGALLLLPTRFAEIAVKHRFQRILESSKHEQLKLQEQFKQELKSRDDQIASIRALALGGLATRTEVLTRRKLQAAEVVWASVIEYKRYGLAVGMIRTIETKGAMEAASKQNAEGEKVRQFAAMLVETSGVKELKFEARPDRERIFVDPNVWARFTLYRSVMTLPVSKLLAMSNGMKPDFFKDQTPLLVAAKEVLPHMISFIDEHGEDGLSYLHDLFEEEVLKSIIAGFSDTAADTARAEQAAFIISNVNKAAPETQRNTKLEVPESIREDVPPREVT